MNQIEYLERINSFNGRAKLKAKITLHGEKLGGMWSDMYKVRKPRDTSFQLAKLDNTNTVRNPIRLHGRTNKKVSQNAKR